MNQIEITLNASNEYAPRNSGLRPTRRQEVPALIFDFAWFRKLAREDYPDRSASEIEQIVQSNYLYAVEVYRQLNSHG